MGILIGTHPWSTTKWVSHIGLVEGNVSKWNVINLVIDGVQPGGGVLRGNLLEGHQGSVGKGACTYSADYTAADFGGLDLQYQPGFDWLAYDNDQCTPRQTFAEGDTGFFDTTLVLKNPRPTPTLADVSFKRSDGGLVSIQQLVPAQGQTSIDVQNVPGMANTSFGTVVASPHRLEAERLTSWGGATPGSHAEVALSPSLSWYFAEGATFAGFDLYFMVMNPDPTRSAGVRVEFVPPAPAAPVVRNYTLAPLQRTTLWVDALDPQLASTEVFTIVKSTNNVPVVVERSMYWNWAAGHSGAGMVAPRLKWYFAEGDTGGFFDTFLTLANPNGTQASIEVDYWMPGGSKVTVPRSVGAGSRTTIWVNHEPGLSGGPVSCVVRSTNGVAVVAERAMWWPRSGWYESHVNAGAEAPGTKWVIADARVGGATAAYTYALIANTASSASTVRVTVDPQAGGSLFRDYVLPAYARLNVSVGDEFPSVSGPCGVRVDVLSGGEIVVERALYESPGGVFWSSGAVAHAKKLQ